VGGGSAGGNFGCTNCGILVAGTAPKGIKKEPNGRDPKATVIIYDAVGNIVFKSKPNEITLIEDKNTFGFVWNGKNNKGRVVGPGTYLVRMYVELDGDKFVEQRKIGVTKSTK
jgi:flagellar hook assembly protein FlgD